MGKLGNALVLVMENPFEILHYMKYYTEKYLLGTVNRVELKFSYYLKLLHLSYLERMHSNMCSLVY